MEVYFMKSSLRFVSRVLVVGLTISLIPARVWAMEEVPVQKNSPKNHVLQSLQRVVPRFPNIRYYPEILNVLNQYQSDDQIIDALRPLTKIEGASGYFDVARISDIRNMRGEELDNEIFNLLSPLNDQMGIYGKGFGIKTFLVSHLQNGLPNAEEIKEQKRKEAEAELLEANARRARQYEEALRQQEEERREEEARKKAEAQAREDERIARKKELEDQAARLKAQLDALKAGKTLPLQTNSVEQAQPVSSSATPNHVMIEVPVEREEPEISDHVQPHDEPAQMQEQKEEQVPQQNYDDDDSEEDSLEAAMAEWGREQAALREAEANHNQEHSPRELSPIVVRTPVAQSSVSEEEILEQSRPAQEPVVPVVNEEEVARFERELEQIRLRQEEENRRREQEREAERQAEQEAEHQRQELERQRQEAERQARNVEQEAQQARAQADQPAAARVQNANGQPNLFAAGLFGVLNNLWSWIKENPVKSTAIGLGIAFGLYKLISNLFGIDDEDDAQEADEDEATDADEDRAPGKKKRRPAAGKAKQSAKTVSSEDAEKFRLQALKRKRARLRRAFLKNRANCCNVRCCGRR